MGTVVTIDVYLEGTARQAPETISRACAVLHEADAVFSTWRRDSPMNRLRQEAIRLEEVPSEVAEVLAACAHLREVTDGWFDPWAMPGGVDPTGFVKGWAATRAAAELRGDGAAGAVVNAAGDVACWGSHAPGQPFRIGVVDPFDRRRLCCTVELPGGAIATSGTYERGAHLIDPRSGARRARLASASVCGPNLGTADALATALAVCGTSGLRFIEDLPGYEALAVTPAGEWRVTDGFPFASVDADAVDPGRSRGPRARPVTRWSDSTTVLLPTCA